MGINNSNKLISSKLKEGQNNQSIRRIKQETLEIGFETFN